ncbi:hypothetical protein PR048_024301 [Dryococelus australis]|uniref:Transposase n=1 Tax=Dryococelus australis TaxID=614101 RepID=A0ABQ9GN71_9NEOP|nr:hypothetical protein PR048_024301 [Dryococelus australis]
MKVEDAGKVRRVCSSNGMHWRGKLRCSEKINCLTTTTSATFLTCKAIRYRSPSAIVRGKKMVRKFFDSKDTEMFLCRDAYGSRRPGMPGTWKLVGVASVKDWCGLAYFVMVRCKFYKRTNELTEQFIIEVYFSIKVPEKGPAQVKPMSATLVKVYKRPRDLLLARQVASSKEATARMLFRMVIAVSCRGACRHVSQGEVKSCKAWPWKFVHVWDKCSSIFEFSYKSSNSAILSTSLGVDGWCVAGPEVREALGSNPGQGMVTKCSDGKSVLWQRRRVGNRGRVLGKLILAVVYRYLAQHVRWEIRFVDETIPRAPNVLAYEKKTNFRRWRNDAFQDITHVRTTIPKPSSIVKNSILRLPHVIIASRIVAMRHLMCVPVSPLAFARFCAMSRQLGGPLKRLNHVRNISTPRRTAGVIRGSMNTEAYCNILDNEMLPTLWRFYGMDPCYFQDDNARCHVSRTTMQWYADNNVRRLDWPAQSPDLNPIEHL